MNAPEHGIIGDPATSAAAPKPPVSGSPQKTLRPVASGRGMTEADIGVLLRKPSRLETGEQAMSQVEELRLRMLFAVFDEDCDGRLRKAELKALLVAADRARMLQDGEEEELIRVLGGNPVSSDGSSEGDGKVVQMRRAASIRVEQEVDTMLAALGLSVEGGEGSSEGRAATFADFQRLC